MPLLPIPDPAIATAIFLVLVFVLFAAGMPITFCLGGTAALFALLFFTPPQWFQIASSMYGSTTKQILIAIPLFILMGGFIIYTGIAENMFKTMYLWAGPIRGALAMGTELIGAVFGAMCGSSEATTLTLGTVAMPEMLKRGYKKDMVLGTIATAGLLGILIPPTVLGIIYCAVTGTSVGLLYFGLFIPGFTLAFLYMGYIGIRCYFNPSLAPALPKEQRASWGEKLVSLKGIIVPVVIMVLILGGIYSGIVTPTEASGIGALSMFIVALARREMTWRAFRESLLTSFKLSAMVVWIMMAITLFSNVYHTMGASKLIQDLALSLPVSGILVIIFMHLTVFVLGMIMDDVVVMMLVTPIYLPIVKALGFDPLWYGICFMILVNCAWLTPPYGFNLFLMKAISPKGVTMSDIYKSVIPFIGLQLVTLVLVMIFPQMALWLPRLIIAK